MFLKITPLQVFRSFCLSLKVTNGGGILVYIRDDIRSRIIECENLQVHLKIWL